MKLYLSSFLFLFSCLIICTQLYAQFFEEELNGYKLYQFNYILEDELGEPFKELESDIKVSKAYLVEEEAYMVFSHLKKYPNNISSIQLTGKMSTPSPVFKGLALGDSIEKINHILGPPAQIINIEQPKLQRFEYAGQNYSVEIDQNDKLYSILLFMPYDFFNKVQDDDSTWELFSQAIYSKNQDAILEMIRPDIEIYKAGETISIKTSYKKFKNNNQAFFEHFIADKNSIYEAIKETVPIMDFRLVLDFGVGKAFKFPENNLLREIVFFPYNGKYRIYEIAFRN